MFSSCANGRFQWDKLLFWGIGIYAVMFLLWNFFVLYGFTAGIIPRIILLVALVIAATLSGRSLHLSKAADILPYAVGWVVITMILDTLMISLVIGLSMYADWNIWVGYLLLLTIPLLAPHTKHAPEPPHIT